MNFAQLRTAFYDFVDDEVKDLYKTDKAGRLINNALRMLGRKLEAIDEKLFLTCKLYAVTANEKDLVFTLPENFKRVGTVERLFDGKDPVPVTWVNFPDRHSAEPWPPHRLRTNNRPVCYLLGNRLGVVTPAEDYTLRMWYHRAIPQLEDEGDIPEGIPQDHHETVALQAAKLAYQIESRVFPFQDEYEQGMQDLMTTVQPRQGQEPRYVHMVDYWHGN